MTDPAVWPEIVGVIVGQALGVLLWSALLHAPILQWRARKLKGWNIAYMDACLVSIKAWLLAVVASDVTMFAMALTGVQEEAFLGIVGTIVMLSAWFLMHSNALLKLSRSSILISVSDARYISRSVLAFIFGVFFGIVLIFVVIALLVNLLK